MIEKQYFNSIRDLVDEANRLELQNDDMQIVNAQDEPGYYLVYQRREHKKVGRKPKNQLTDTQ